MGSDFIVEAKGLTKRFGGFVAVKDLNLGVRRHAIHALIGPNGAGKTTCFNLLTRFLDPSEGSILFKGADVTRRPAADVARLGMVRSFQISATFGNLTVLENVRVALQRDAGHSFHFWKAARCLAALDARAMELIASVGLADFAENVVAELPYGRKRALEIATTLALEPELMLLDEPTSGMGHEDIARTSQLIRRAAEGRTVLLVEHNLSVVAELAHDITVLARGEILAQGSYADVSRNEDVVRAYLGRGGKRA